MLTCTLINISCEKIQVISQLISVIVLIISLLYISRQVKEMRLSTYATAYKTVLDILQNEETRAARNYVFKKLKEKPFDKWSINDIAEAEKVCQSYDSVGQMVRNGILPKNYVVDHWKSGLAASWQILSPLVKKYRTERYSPEDWDDYEYLAKEASFS